VRLLPNFVTAHHPKRSRGVASRRHLRRANRSLPPPLIDDSDSDQDDLSFVFGNFSITLSSTSTSSRYYSCNLFYLFYLINMFNLSSVRVMLTLVDMIYDVINLVDYLIF
jgi:hypothetical protein